MFLTNSQASSNADCSKAIALAFHPEHRVRRELADTSELCEDIRMMLAHDEAVDVRLSIALNTATSEEVLITMLLDDSALVRYALAGRFELKHDSLARLVDDEHEHIRSRALQTLIRNSTFTDTTAAA